MTDTRNGVRKSKAKLEREIAELKSELREEEAFKALHHKKIAEFDAIVRTIFNIHQPHPHSNTSYPGGDFLPRVTMRCSVCQTPEHHTNGPRNYELWPCPTIARFVNVRQTITKEDDD